MATTRAWRIRVRAAIAGVLSYVSYLLMLYAFRLVPAATALAFRQVAPALAPVVGAIWLRERSGWRAYLGSLLIAASAVWLVLG